MLVVGRVLHSVHNNGNGKGGKGEEGGERGLRVQILLEPSEWE